MVLSETSLDGSARPTGGGENTGRLAWEETDIELRPSVTRIATSAKSGITTCSWPSAACLSETYVWCPLQFHQTVGQGEVNAVMGGDMEAGASA